MQDYLGKVINDIIYHTSLFKEKEWIFKISSDRGYNFNHVIYKKLNLPTQGYKLHISSTPVSALTIVKRVLPILSTERVTFKICSTLNDLLKLLNGKAGLTQLGKFITIYPYDYPQVVRLATALDKATAGLSRAVIPFERSIGPRSCVFYRYGAFSPIYFQTDKGDITLGIRDKYGQLVQDKRDDPLQMLHTDPFKEAGIKTWLKKNNPLLRNRYLRLVNIYQSVKGKIWVGLNIGENQVPIILIKEAYHGVMIDNNGHDSQDRLESGVRIIQNLQNCIFCPKLIDYWKGYDESYLICEYIEGTDLDLMIKHTRTSGKKINECKIIKWSLELCDILKEIHKREIIYCDLKPKNIIVDKDEHLHLIDYETASYKCTSEMSIPGKLVTRGYCSPQQLQRESHSEQDDIYSLGTTLFSIATLVDLTSVPTGWNPIDHMDHFTNISSGLQSIIQKCLQQDINKRFKNIDEIQNKIIKISSMRRTKSSITILHDRSTNIIKSYLSLAEGIGDLICNIAKNDGKYVYWNTQHPSSNGIPRDIYIGVSGIGLFLASLYKITNNSKYLSFAEKAALWLENSSDKIGRDIPLPGLFIGESGVGLFYLKLFKETHNTRYLKLSIARNNLVSEIPYLSSDLVNGASGTGLFSLILFDTTDNHLFLERAIKIGKFLLDSNNFYAEQYIGLAHGTAGIGYFFLELVESTKESIYLNAVIDIARWLIELSEPTLDDNSGLIWPYTKERKKYGIFWCHGTAGIGQFFLRCYQIMRNKKYLDIAIRAAKTIYHRGKWIGTTQCHGLSGNIEFLVDLYNVTGDKLILGWAYDLASLLITYKIYNSGNYKWQSEVPDVFTPDYMVGYSGVGACMLRLADPSQPRALSRIAFKH